MINNSILLIITALFLGGCSVPNSNDESANYKHIAGATQGTFYSIKYSDTVDYQKDIDSLLNNFDFSLSTYNSASIISRVNANDSTIVLDSLFYAVFRRSVQIAKETNGAFDFTVAPFIEAWGFGKSKRQHIDKAIIDSIRQFVGYDKIRIENGKIQKTDLRVCINTNAIAQGFSVDVIAGFLDEKKIENYLVEIGGEIFTRGKNPKGNNWSVGIDNPVDDTTMQRHGFNSIVEISGKAIATSGNYRKFYEINGKKYAHTLDPQTGRPVSHPLLSATVVAADCMSADAYATAFMVMGAEKTIEFAKQHLEIAIYLISAGENETYDVYMTDNFKELIQSKLPDVD